MESGYRVGISSNSHKAIHELLGGVERQAAQKNYIFVGCKKASRGFPDSFYDSKLITNQTSVKNIDIKNTNLIAGTAYLFCNTSLNETLDYLFVDEAGQVSLAHLAAMAGSARNIVLIGDQMQLGQPIQGTHPGQSGMSTLEYLLLGQDTVPPNKGVLLPVSYRMNPDICNFISDSLYDGKLKAAPGNEKQVLKLETNSHIPGKGLGFVEVEHEGRSQTSQEEGEVVRKIYEEALCGSYTDREGSVKQITDKDIMVVTPYNAQVNHLKELLPKEARVGTIDLFQGQEAQLVIISMTTSSREDMPRNIEFLFSRNRLNVAISRARCSAVIVANPNLLTIPCTTIEQMSLVNLLCWSKNSSNKVVALK